MLSDTEQSCIGWDSETDTASEMYDAKGPHTVQKESVKGTGSTFWDFIQSNGLWILLISLSATVFLSVIFLDFEWLVSGMGDFLKSYWPILLSPIVGYAFGTWIMGTLYRPEGRYLIHLNPEHHSIRVVFIPERMFRLFRQTGNNIVYHSPVGSPVYVAENLDTDNGYISYGWVHELNSLEVMTREKAYINWDSTLNKVLEENLDLMINPHILGLGYSRKAIKDHLDRMAEVMGISDKDLPGSKESEGGNHD